jgi:ketosteroid isomerase-like protein
MKKTFALTIFVLAFVSPVPCRSAGEQTTAQGQTTGQSPSQSGTAATSGQTASQTTTSQSKDEQEIARLEKEWDDAVIKADKAALARIAAEDYFNYSDPDNGRGRTRDQFIAGFGSNPRPPDVTEKHEIDQVMTRLLGDVAIVNARVTPVITVKGQEQERGFRGQFTHVWVKRGGRWQLVGDQYNPTTPVMKPPVAAKVDASVLDAYVGKYGDITVAKEGENLVATAGQNKFPLTPMSDTSFFIPNIPVRITFIRNSKGQVTHAYINENGRANEIEKSK